VTVDAVDAVAIVLAATDVDEIVETVARLAPSFGGINLDRVASRIHRSRGTTRSTGCSASTHVRPTSPIESQDRSPSGATSAPGQ
jgi:hypothetical protein